MNIFSIRNILISGIALLLMIWGVIFYLALSDTSYKLFIPSLPVQAWLPKQITVKSDLPESGPWKQDLFMGSGTLSEFGGKSFLVHGTATPSAIYKNNDVVVYFNYYPSENRRTFGTVNWIKSSDQGRTWSLPSPVIIKDLPELTTNPISPQAIMLPSGKIKLYFIAKKVNEDRNKLFASISNDGVNFTFDPTTQFEIENESLISFGITILNDRMHLIAYTQEGATTQTMYNAISYDTKVFTRLADAVIEDSFYGQTSLVSNGNSLQLLGASPQGLWSSTSRDGNSWSDPDFYNFSVQNPHAVFVGEKYLIFYTANTEPQASPTESSL